jgi:hypothetical protein
MPNPSNDWTFIMRTILLKQFVPFPIQSTELPIAISAANKLSIRADCNIVGIARHLLMSSNLTIGALDYNTISTYLPAGKRQSGKGEGNRMVGSEL